MSSNNPKVLETQDNQAGVQGAGARRGAAKSLITTPTRSQGLGECLGRSPAWWRKPDGRNPGGAAMTWGEEGWKEEGAVLISLGRWGGVERWRSPGTWRDADRARSDETGVAEEGLRLGFSSPSTPSP